MHQYNRAGPFSWCRIGRLGGAVAEATEAPRGRLSTIKVVRQYTRSSLIAIAGVSQPSRSIPRVVLISRISG
jgi:hypothetical protein